MPLRLPRVIVGREGVHECPDGVLTDVEIQRLIALEARAGRARWTVERCLPLEGRRWAVGRRVGERGMWRIVGPDELDRVGGHPAWLWTTDAWFDPDAPADRPARAPAALPLRSLVRFAAPLGGRSRRTVKALAATIAALREADRPVAVVVPPELLASASHPGRWFVLSLLTILPPTHRDVLAVMLGEPHPTSGDARLALTPEAPAGYVAIDVAAPPDEGDDLVAYYLRNRLYDDDPEALEAAAYLYDGGEPGDDRWGAGIAALIRDGVPGVSEVTDDLITSDPERAVRALTARLRAGAPLDATLLRQLVAVTRHTGDPRPWGTLWSRSAVQRADAVDTLLADGRDMRPTAELVRMLGALYPRGAPLDEWVPTLLHWLHRGVAPAAVVAVLQTTLLEWPLAATSPTRASVWSEVVLALVHLGEDEAALDAIVGPVARELAREGHGRALVSCWTAIPATFRDPEAMAAFVGLLQGAPDGEAAIVDLYRAVRNRLDEAEALVHAWVDLNRVAPSPDDPLLAAVRGTDYLAAWAAAACADDDLPTALSVLGRWASGPEDPLWVLAAEAQVRQAGAAPRRKLLALAAVSPLLGRLDPRARGLLGEVIRDTAFPDAELAASTERLAGLSGAGPIWGLVTVCAATPGSFDDPTIDATVVALGESEPDAATIGLAATALRGLGAAPGWQSLELARWIVRLALAPMNAARSTALAVALTQGIAQRDDGEQRMIEICRIMLDLPTDHPALYVFLDQLLPTAWQGGVPRSLIDAFPIDTIPPDLHLLWQHLGA